METDVIERFCRFGFLHLFHSFLLYIIHIGRERSAGIFSSIFRSLTTCMRKQKLLFIKNPVRIIRKSTGNYLYNIIHMCGSRTAINPVRFMSVV